MEELIRVLLDGGKIDSVNQPYIEKILRNLGKTLSDIEKQTPIVDFRYSKEYRTEALDELYNEFTLHAKKSVETIFSKTFDYTSARNELLATPGQMRKRRVQATINPPKNAHLIDELSRARNGTGPSGPRHQRLAHHRPIPRLQHPLRILWTMMKLPHLVQTKYVFPSNNSLRRARN